MGVRDLGGFGDAHSLLELGGSRGVTSVKIRVAIGVPARGAGWGRGACESGSCGAVVVG